MSNDDHLLGTIMREARIKSHITQEELAEKVHVNLTHLGNIERGTSNPSLPLFCNIIRALNISADAYIYPHREVADNTSQEIMHLLSQCSEKERKIILANLHTLIENREEE